ncbi:MAG: sugar phosphate isomerase/epimerase [Oceanospirillaceae bacterium]|jgi:sugar phosphate isomerase/epimerase
MKKLNRRAFLKYSAFTVAVGALSIERISATNLPNFKTNGVQIGAITYSFRSMPGSVDNIIQYCQNAGISAVELMGDVAEHYAGAPENPVTKRRNLTSEEAKIAATHTNDLATWRANASMKGFKKLRTKLKKAGIKVYAFKPNALRESNTDEEIAYAMQAAKALGANSVTVEIPNDTNHTARLGEIAKQHKMYIGYHAHTQATDTLWDESLAQSPYNSINLDCGHYIAAGGDNTKESLLNFIRKNHERITSMHLKDRTTAANGAKNLVWGMGDTPICDVLQLLRDENYDIPVSIELEYDISEDSDAVQEVKKCVEYTKKCLV